MRGFIVFYVIYLLLLFPTNIFDVAFSNPNVQRMVYIIPHDEMTEVETIKI